MRARVLILWAVLLLFGFGCDRRDNDWDAFEPGLKLVSVTTDTLHVAEGGQTAGFTVTLGMVPSDTVLVRAFSVDQQVTVSPDTLVFIPVDDHWADPQTVTVTAVDDHIREGDHGGQVEILSLSPDPGYDHQTGEGVIPIMIADNDSVGVLISESSLTLVESEAGVVRETYWVRLTSEPVAPVTVQTNVVPAEPSLHVEPSALIFEASAWDQPQEIVLWLELDDIDNDDLVVTIEHSALSSDPDYDAGLAIPSLVVSTYDFTLPPVARLHVVTGSTLYENAPLVPVQVQISLDRPSVDPVTLTLSTQNGTAIGGVDFVALNQVVTFSPGTPLAQEFPVTVIDDAEIEPEENFQLVITPLQNVMIGEDDRLLLDVVDNDLTLLTLTVDAVDEDSGSADFLVSIPNPETVPVLFTFSTADGTALAGEDYEALSQSYVLEPGDTQRQISVVLQADDYYEPDETFTASLSGISANAGWDGAPVECTIVNDDPQAVAMDDVTIHESDGNAVFTLNLLAPYNEDVVLTLNTLDGDGIDPVGSQLDALGGSDFSTVVNQTFTIPANTTAIDFSVPLLADGAAESLHEFFRLEITGADHEGFAGLSATATLVDDDQPCLMVADVTAVESDPTVTFTVQLLDSDLNPVTSTADVRFLAQTADQTAEADADYTPVSQTFFIPAGQSEVDIPVTLLDDNHDDDNETFVLLLSDLFNAADTCGTENAFCTLIDNEFPSLNLQSAATRLNEGSAWEFTVLLTTPRQEDTHFDLNLDAGTSQGPGVDYTFTGNGTHVIPAMTTELTFTVPYLDDQLADEPDEVINANISQANVALGVMDLQATIVDAPELSIGSAAANEGETAVFDVFLDEPSTADIQFSIQFANDTATMGDDFDNTATGPYTFLAGETATTVPVAITAGDGGDAATEVFVVTVVSPTNATVSADNSGLGTITDMDPPEISWAGDATGLEGENIEFTVNLSWTSEVGVEFYVNFIDGSAARAGIDYDDSFNGPFIVPAGATSFTVPVPAVADGAPELTLEDFTIMLNSPTNGVLGMPISATGYVEDADQPFLTIPNGVTANEGENLVFTVHLSEQTIVPVFFQLEYDLGSTQGGSDFVAPPSGVLSMMAGTVDTTITISTVEDAVHENQEAFILRLAADPTNAQLGTPFENNGVINDDDP